MRISVLPLFVALVGLLLLLGPLVAPAEPTNSPASSGAVDNVGLYDGLFDFFRILVGGLYFSLGAIVTVDEYRRDRRDSQLSFKRAYTLSLFASGLATVIAVVDSWAESQLGGPFGSFLVFALVAQSFTFGVSSSGRYDRVGTIAVIIVLVVSFSVAAVAATAAGHWLASAATVLGIVVIVAAVIGGPLYALGRSTP